MSTAELVEQIDAKWTKDGWAIHRRYDGQWMVHGPPGTVLHAETVEGALQAAAEYVPLPEIPRRPSGVGFYDVKKRGTRWDVCRNDRMTTGGYTTKKEAKAIADKLAGFEKEAYESWIGQHSHFVETHTEGVDFRFKD